MSGNEAPPSPCCKADWRRSDEEEYFQCGRQLCDDLSLRSFVGCFQCFATVCCKTCAGETPTPCCQEAWCEFKVPDAIEKMRYDVRAAARASTQATPGALYSEASDDVESNGSEASRPNRLNPAVAASCVEERTCTVAWTGLVDRANPGVAVAKAAKINRHGGSRPPKSGRGGKPAPNPIEKGTSHDFPSKWRKG